MKLLIVTQKVDKHDDVLGFFHDWIKDFAQLCESVTVICLEKGESELPKNVTVLSLGKELGRKKFSYVTAFLKYIWTTRSEYTNVFVHMNPEYIVIGGLLWRMLGKKIHLWYVHRNVNLWLRIAHLLSHQVFSVTRESFGIRSSKLKLVGHGIDAQKFSMSDRTTDPSTYRIISVGRITPIKRLETLIKAASILAGSNNFSFTVDLIGSPVSQSDQKYKNELIEMIERNDLNDKIHFLGSCPYDAIPDIYHNADLLVNLAPTGGIDKVVLEAMASGLIPMVSNRGFTSIFKDRASTLIFNQDDPVDLANRIGQIHGSDCTKMREEMRHEVLQNHSQKELIQRIFSAL